MGFVEKVVQAVSRPFTGVKVTSFLPARCFFSESIRSTASGDYDHLLQMTFLDKDRIPKAVIKSTVTSDAEEVLDGYVSTIIQQLEALLVFRKNYIIVRDSPTSFVIRWNTEKEKQHGR